MKFQKITTEDRVLNQIQDNINSSINPLLTNPLSSGQLLQQILLVTGDNSINHRLGRKLIGWFITRPRDVVADVYDTQDSNPMPQLTLNLNSSAAIIVDIFVF